MEWTHQSGDSYVVTGKTVKGRRFRIQTSNPVHALGINRANGSLWLIRNGKRKLLNRI